MSASLGREMRWIYVMGNGKNELSVDGIWLVFEGFCCEEQPLLFSVSFIRSFEVKLFKIISYREFVLI